MHDDSSSTGPRAFFTEYDRDAYANTDWYPEDLAEFEATLPRKVKLLALTKDRVVIPVSHLLESELAREFVLANPAAITRGVIVPALRDDTSDALDFLALKRDSHEAWRYQHPDTVTVARLLDEHATPIGWNAEKAGCWLRDRLLGDLADATSVLRIRMASASGDHIERLRYAIASRSTVSRGEILACANDVFGLSATQFPRPQLPFGEYVDFLYYLSGAVSVDAEGVLPQENLVQFDITTPEQRSERLSEYEIFYRLFIHIVRTHTQRVLHEQILDALTFDDVADLRTTPAYHDFVAKYNGLLKRAKRATPVHDPTGLVLRLEELEQFEWEVRHTFATTIAREAREHARQQERRAELGLLASIASAITFYGVVDSVVEVAANGLSALGGDDLQRQVCDRTERIADRLQRLIDRRGVQDRAVLLEFLGKITSRYKRYLPED